MAPDVQVSVGFGPGTTTTSTLPGRTSSSLKWCVSCTFSPAVTSISDPAALTPTYEMLISGARDNRSGSGGSI